MPYIMPRCGCVPVPGSQRDERTAIKHRERERERKREREREQSVGGVAKGIVWSSENNIESAPILIQSVSAVGPLFCVRTAPPHAAYGVV